MIRPLIVVAALVVLAGCASSGDNSADDWFAFHPASDIDSSVIGASDWLDPPTGNHGIVQIEGDEVVFEDGTPVKFWGVNVEANRSYPEPDTADQWAEHLARHGVNAVRYHKFTEHALRNQPRSTVLDSMLFDRLDDFSAQLREKGIYYGWSHIYGHVPRPGDRTRLRTYEEHL